MACVEAVDLREVPSVWTANETGPCRFDLSEPRSIMEVAVVHGKPDLMRGRMSERVVCREEGRARSCVNKESVGRNGAAALSEFSG